MSICLVCNCNKTLSIQQDFLAQVTEQEVLPIQEGLCRHQSGVLDEALINAQQKDQTMVVACTQEAPLFRALAGKQESRLHFVNIRETAGWGQESKQSQPKIAALLAVAIATAEQAATQVAQVEPLPTVRYAAGTKTLIIAPASIGLRWAQILSSQLDVCLLIVEENSPSTLLPTHLAFPIIRGKLRSLQGWLGAFEATWALSNPIDLEACTRCGACITACPEEAIDFSFQIDMSRCQGHRHCVTACGATQAINFADDRPESTEHFDMVLDLQQAPYFTQHQPPRGYLHCPPDNMDAQLQLTAQLLEWVGESEKPVFFRYQSKICAHSRSKKEGCNLCIDVCSTQAIRSHGDHIQVEPYLCMGCGACTTVCPSGAIRYAYPDPQSLGTRIKTLLDKWFKATSLLTQPSSTGTASLSAPVLLLYGKDGETLLDTIGRHTQARTSMAIKLSRGVPSRVLPLSVYHIATVGLEVWLAALAYGAQQILVVTDKNTAPEYLTALHKQAEIAQTILHAWGYSGQLIHIIEPLDSTALESYLWSLETGIALKHKATWHLNNDKRRNLDFALDHLYKQAPKGTDTPEIVSLPAQSLYGTIEVNRDTCTLCLSCVGVCPANALSDNPETPQLRFTEQNCVQCGLCENTCPEKAIRLIPRLHRGEEARKPQILNESQPFHCISCHKPFGTRQMVTNMSKRLQGHSMFADNVALTRLQMCADCRVVDMMKQSQETKIQI